MNVKKELIKMAELKKDLKELRQLKLSIHLKFNNDCIEMAKKYSVRTVASMFTKRAKEYVKEIEEIEKEIEQIEKLIEEKYAHL